MNKDNAFYQITLSAVTVQPPVFYLKWTFLKISLYIYLSWSHFEAEHRNILVLKGLRFQFRKLLCIYLKRPMAVHVPRRWDVKWVVGKALIAFLLLVSVSATSSHQNTDNKTTSPSNGTIGVDHHAKAFYKHHWPVRELCFHIILCQFQITTMVIKNFRTMHVPYMFF